MIPDGPDAPSSGDFSATSDGSDDELPEQGSAEYQESINRAMDPYTDEDLDTDITPTDTDDSGGSDASTTSGIPTPNIDDVFEQGTDAFGDATDSAGETVSDGATTTSGGLNDGGSGMFADLIDGVDTRTLALGLGAVGAVLVGLATLGGSSDKAARPAPQAAPAGGGA